jgi:predicted nuclease with TOPRIM domain
MLEPLTAIGLAGTLIQFVDFSSKIVSKASAIYASADGALPENQDAETVAQSLQVLDAKIRAGLATSSGTKSEEALKELCGECDSVAQELLKALEKLKIYDRKTKWKSMRQALKSVSSKGKIDDISKRLENLRDQLSLSFLVELRYVWSRFRLNVC